MKRYNEVVGVLIMGIIFGVMFAYAILGGLF